MVSIILPCYNAAAYLASAIDSVLNQSYANWELIIINDGSTDPTDEIIRSYKDPRIVYIFQKNKGVSHARNRGLKIIKGDFFCFLDADDIFTAGSLENRLRIFDNNPKVKYVDGSIEVFDQYMEKRTYHWNPDFKGSPFDELLTLSGKCFFSLTWMIRKDPKTNHQFHEKLTHGEDLLYFIEISSTKGLYEYCKDPILKYRKGHNSAMKNIKGLENGYRYIYNVLHKNQNVSQQQLKLFRGKAGNIIFKSYLGNLQLVNAFHSLYKKWLIKE